MIKIINDRYELLDFKKSNIYDFTPFEVVIITFDYKTEDSIKANKIVCCKLEARHIICQNISSIDDIICNTIKSNIIICNKLLSDYVTSNDIQSIEINVVYNILSFNISCNTILSRHIVTHYIKCDNCYTNELNAREQHIKHMYSFNEYCI